MLGTNLKRRNVTTLKVSRNREDVIGFREVREVRMKITISTDDETIIGREVARAYNSSPVRNRLHVSSLIGCLRQTVLMQQYEVDWKEATAFRFVLGRVFEKITGMILLKPYSLVAEKEVEEEGIVGHIDFADDRKDGIDWEVKLTVGSTPDDPTKFFYDKDYWLLQAGSYAVMRRRLEMKFLVFHLWFTPTIRVYKVSWTKDELGDIWERMLDAKDVLTSSIKENLLPPRTEELWRCKGCPVYKVCYLKEERQKKKDRVVGRERSSKGWR